MKRLKLDRKTLLLCVLMLLGYAFIYITPLVTIGIAILIGIVLYDNYRTQKEWERKHT